MVQIIVMSHVIIVSDGLAVITVRRRCRCSDVNQRRQRGDGQGESFHGRLLCVGLGSRRTNRRVCRRDFVRTKSKSHASQLENDLRCLIPGDYNNGDGNGVVASVAQVTTTLLTLILPQSVSSKHGLLGYRQRTRAEGNGDSFADFVPLRRIRNRFVNGIFTNSMR